MLEQAGFIQIIWNMIKCWNSSVYTKTCQWIFAVQTYFFWF